MQASSQKVYRAVLLPSPVRTASTSTPAELAPLPSSPSAVPVLLKHRFPKRYRHPALDAQLTRQRLTSEARALVRCSKAGVRVPGLRLVDVRQGCLGMEWIEGWSVREVLGGGQEDQDDVTTDAAEDEAEEIGALLLAAGVDEGASGPFFADCIYSLADIRR